MSLRLLNYERAKKALMLTLSSDDHRVPMLMGERGVGKTAMMYEISKEINANLVCIDANVLKEGEAGGLPIVYTEGGNSAIHMEALISGISRLAAAVGNNDFKYNPEESFKAVVSGLKKFALEEKKILERSDGDKRVMTYAPHVKMKELQELYDKHPKRKTILFIDEFNRCDNIVKRELMNLILNREINGFKLPENVYVICACNPTSNFSVYADSDYQVEEMDEAQLDRFRWIAMKSDISQWINWGMSTNPATGESYIDDQVIEFLMDREDFLNNITSSKEDIKTSPRSWEFVSNTYRAFIKATQSEKNSGVYTQNDLLNAISGDVGLNVASTFISFLEDNSNPLIRPEEIFEGESFARKKLTSSVISKISSESILRKNVLARNCLRYIKSDFCKAEGNVSKAFTIKENLFIEILTKTLGSADLMYSIILDMKISKDNDDKIYLKHLLDLKNIDILNAYTKLNQSF